MTDTRLAIVAIDPETGQVMIVHDHGPCTNDEFIAAYGMAYAAQTDWDITLDAMLGLIVKEQLLTDEGMSWGGYTIGSALHFIKDNIDSFLPTGKKKLGVRTMIKLLDGAAKILPEGKKLDLDLEELKALMIELQEPFLRQMLRDPERRNLIRPAMPATVLLYENPPSLSDN